MVCIWNLKQKQKFFLRRLTELNPRQFEMQHDKTNKIACAPSKDSDQPGHPPSLISVFAVRFMGSLGPSASSCGQQRLWSDWANAQADLSLRWAHRSFCCFCLASAYLRIEETFIQRNQKTFTEWNRRQWNRSSGYLIIIFYFSIKTYVVGTH